MELKRIANFFRILLGISWLLAGIIKIIFFDKIIDTFSIFVEENLIPFYANFIKEVIVPNSYLVTILIILLEILSGVLILFSGIYSKIGLVLGICMNISFLPLIGFKSVLVNTIFILLEIFVLLKADLSKNYLIYLYRIVKK